MASPVAMAMRPSDRFPAVPRAALSTAIDEPAARIAALLEPAVPTVPLLVLETPPSAAEAYIPTLLSPAVATFRPRRAHESGDRALAYLA